MITTPGQHFPFSGTLTMARSQEFPTAHYQLSSMLTNLIYAHTTCVPIRRVSQESFERNKDLAWVYASVLQHCSSENYLALSSHIMLSSVLDQSWGNEMFDVMY